MEKVDHHESKHHQVQTHHEHHAHHQKEEQPEQKKERTVFSLKSKLGNLLKEAVELSEEDLKKAEAKEDEHIQETMSAYEAAAESFETVEEKKELPIEEHEPDEEDVKEREREETRDKIHEYILSKLNTAVSEWKETGDVGIHIAPPVPIRERVMNLISRFRKPAHIEKKSVEEKQEEIELKEEKEQAPAAEQKEQSAVNVIEELEKQVDAVAEKVSERIETAKSEGKKVDTNVLVHEEWKAVIKRLEAVAPKNERDEIDKLYKELSGEL